MTLQFLLFWLLLKASSVCSNVSLWFPGLWIFCLIVFLVALISLFSCVDEAAGPQIILIASSLVSSPLLQFSPGFMMLMLLTLCDPNSSIHVLWLLVKNIDVCIHSFIFLLNQKRSIAALLSKRRAEHGVRLPVYFQDTLIADVTPRVVSVLLNSEKFPLSHRRRGLNPLSKIHPTS